MYHNLKYRYLNHKSDVSERKNNKQFFLVFFSLFNLHNRTGIFPTYLVSKLQFLYFRGVYN